MKFDVTRVLIPATIAAGLLLTGIAAHSVPTKPVAKSKSTTTKSKPAVAAKPVLAPNFTLKDPDGVKHSLSDYRGRPVALYFFCGCDWCHAVAGKWSLMQRAGAMPTSTKGKEPVTLIVFQGDGKAAKQFAQETQLDPASNVLLGDEEVHVTVDLYDAEPCPRIFVLDPAGKVVYTNNHKDDAARVAPADVIATRALDALRKAAAVPSAKSTAG